MGERNTSVEIKYREGCTPRTAETQRKVLWHPSKSKPYAVPEGLTWSTKLYRG